MYRATYSYCKLVSGKFQVATHTIPVKPNIKDAINSQIIYSAFADTERQTSDPEVVCDACSVDISASLIVTIVGGKTHSMFSEQKAGECSPHKPESTSEIFYDSISFYINDYAGCTQSNPCNVYRLSASPLRFKILKSIGRDEVFTPELETPTFANGTITRSVFRVALSNSNLRYEVVGDNVRIYSNASGKCKITYTVTLYVKMSDGVTRTYVSTECFPLSGEVEASVKYEQTIEYVGRTELIVGSIVELMSESSAGLTEFIYTCDESLATIVGNILIPKKFGIIPIHIVQPGNVDYSQAEIDVVLVCSIDNLSPVLATFSGGVHDLSVLIRALILIRVCMLMRVNSIVL